MLTEKQRKALNEAVGEMMALSSSEIKAIMEKDTDGYYARLLYEINSELLNTFSGQEVSIPVKLNPLSAAILSQKYYGISVSSNECSVNTNTSEGDFLCLAA